MTAIALSPSAPLFSIVGLAVIAAIVVVAAHWGAGACRTPQTKRLIAVSLIVSIVAVVFAPVARAEGEDDPDFVMLNVCDRYPPWSVLWVYHLCMLPRRKRRLPLARRAR